MRFHQRCSHTVVFEQHVARLGALIEGEAKMQPARADNGSLRFRHRPMRGGVSTIFIRWLAKTIISLASSARSCTWRWLCGFLYDPMAPAIMLSSATRSPGGASASVRGPVVPKAFWTNATPMSSAEYPPARRIETSNSRNAWNTAVSYSPRMNADQQHVRTDGCSSPRGSSTRRV